MDTNRIHGLFITEDQAYDLACRDEFLKATPYNLAIMQMQQQPGPAKTSQRGFSLIEIQVVLVIMGLLISIIAPNVLGRADEARVQKVFADFSAIETALRMQRQRSC